MLAELGYHVSTENVRKRPLEDEMKFDELDLEASKKLLAEMPSQSITGQNMKEGSLCEDTTATGDAEADRQTSSTGTALLEAEPTDQDGYETCETLETCEEEGRMLAMASSQQSSDADTGECCGRFCHDAEYEAFI